MTHANELPTITWQAAALEHSARSVVIEYSANQEESPTVADLWKRYRREPGDGSWETLVRALTPIFRRIVGRVSRQYYANPADTEDALQESMLKLSQRRDVAPGEAVEAYFKAMAANAAHDFFRAQRAVRRDQRRDVPLDSLTFLLSAGDAERGLDRALLIRQIDGMLPADDRDRAVFWLYYRQGLTAKEIASIPAVGLTVKGVESLIFRLTSLVRDKVRQKPGEGIGAGTSS